MQKFEFPDSEPVRSQAWREPFPPQKVLFIRLHALGDLLAALPAAEHFKAQNPSVELQLLTTETVADVPRNMPAFSKIHALANGRGGWPMVRGALRIWPKLVAEGFDAVVDLQNNRLSRAVRKSLFPAAWSQFDRFSKTHAVVRYLKSVNALGLAATEIGQRIRLGDEFLGLQKLREKGWNGLDPIVFLNPCGLFETRRWGLEKYLEFAQIWLEKADPRTKFMLLGLPAMAEKAVFLEQKLGPACLNLVGQTSVGEAFCLIRRADLALSDDGALLHASWLNGVPTIGFLGASPSFWGRPLGPKSFGFDSSDLQCGDCHRSECLFLGVPCLARVTPTMAFERARALLEG